MTVDAICARARVQKGSFYHLFESKSALVAAAIQHVWETILEPAYKKHFSRDNPPLERIKNFLEWVQQFKAEKHRSFGGVPGWPVSLLGCTGFNGEQPIREKLCAIEFEQRQYFEWAIRDAINAKIIDPCDPVTQAMFPRARVEWILARAQLLNELDELKAVSGLSTGLEYSRKNRFEICSESARLDG